jgi:hypothetical protein
MARCTCPGAVTNWAGVSEFLSALASFEWDRLPGLRAALSPEAPVPAATAEVALAELALVPSLLGPIERTYLVDADSGRTSSHRSHADVTCLNMDVTHLGV